MRAAQAVPPAKEEISRARAQSAARLKREPPRPVDVGEDWDILLDALTCLGSGSWAAFAALASQAVPETRPGEVARVLSSLGHIEFDVGSADHGPSRWSVAPGAIVLGTDGRAFLAGSRSRALVDALDRAVRAAGGSLAEEALPGQPRRIRIGVHADDLSGLRERVNSLCSQALAMGGEASQRLLRRLPTLGHLAGQLSVTAFAPRFQETFNLKSACWEMNRGLVGYGQAVRTAEGRRMFGFVEYAQGARVLLRLGTYQMVKHLSALALGQPLIAYNPVDRQVAVPLGAELPWLYERVACLCSGATPSTVSGERRYLGVPPDIAQGLWDRFNSKSQMPK
jgi:hypothetical protein